jgi:two-component system, OmpR family, sensor histidine kinase KdpD
VLGTLGRGRFPPYLAAVAGVAAITAAIAAVRPWVDIPNLVVAYLLLVLLLGARWGWPPAATAAVLAFGAYDFFFVPPYGTLYVSAPRELLNLVVLLAGALAGGRLAAVMASQRELARSAALEFATLYEVAIAALNEPEAAAALRLLCERAAALRGVHAATLVAVEAGRAEVVAGEALSPGELARAEWAAAGGTNLGARLYRGSLEVMSGAGAASDEMAHIVLAGGVAVLRFAREGVEPKERRLLAALLGLAGLLLDRRRAAGTEQRARALEAADRLKAAILSSISHELKSPLASLRAGLTTLSMPEAGLRPEQGEIVAGLDGQAARLDRLVGDLLTMSRLEAGLASERSPQDFADLVATVLRALRPSLEGFYLRLEVPEDLPPVLADELQIERVLTNLLENATEWAPPGGRISVGAEAGELEMAAWVENEGPDIRPVDLDQIFDKFWTGRRGGSGLGLAICRGIVEAHGGRIRAENRRGGPRVTFTLPVAVSVPPRGGVSKGPGERG